jgi:acetyl esterase
MTSDIQPGATSHHPLDPQARDFLQQQAGRVFSRENMVQARIAYRESRIASQAAPGPLAEVRDLVAEGAQGGLPARLYRPRSLQDAPVGGLLPCLVYFHGGGFVLGDLDSHDSLCRTLAIQGQCMVLAIDYRLAPEHRFPCAADDALAILPWLRRQAAGLGIDARRLAVGGDSAGGCLAAVAALGERDAGRPLCLQLLFYPVTDLAHDLPSHTTLGEGYGLTHANLLWYRSQYLADPHQHLDWRASPLRAASHAGLPPAFIVTAGYDALLDEGRVYAERLLQAGVTVTHECFRGMIHGFLLLSAHLAAAHHAIHRAGQALRAAFSAEPTTAFPTFRGPADTPEPRP